MKLTCSHCPRALPAVVLWGLISLAMRAELATWSAADTELKVVLLAGQSNMDGNANVSTIDFLGEDQEHGAFYDASTTPPRP